MSAIVEVELRQIEALGLTFDELGPPRMCYDLDAVEAECKRQEKIAAAGLLRPLGRFGSYGWGRISTGHWIWYSAKSGNPGLGLEPARFEQYEQMWQKAVGKWRIQVSRGNF